MAICEICRQEISSSDGCLTEKLYIDENWYKRLSVMTECCPDCGAEKGFYHHFGCDQEICPKCGKQLLLCECKDIGIEINE